MKYVWAIEQGSYSDYHVVGVFSSKKNAELILNMLSDKEDKPTIAQWILDPAVESINAGLTQWIGAMLRDGTVERCEPWEVSGYDLDDDLMIWRRSTASAYRGKGIQDCLQGKVWAKDQAHAIKIFNEKRTQLIAENKWKESHHAD